MRAELAGLTEEKIRAETVLAQVEELREQAESRRQRAVDQWLACVDTGLPRLRQLPEPTARHITGPAP